LGGWGRGAPPAILEYAVRGNCTPPPNGWVPPPGSAGVPCACTDADVVAEYTKCDPATMMQRLVHYFVSSCDAATALGGKEGQGGHAICNHSVRSHKKNTIFGHQTKTVECFREARAVAGFSRFYFWKGVGVYAQMKVV